MQPIYIVKTVKLYTYIYSKHCKSINITIIFLLFSSDGLNTSYLHITSPLLYILIFTFSFLLFFISSSLPIINQYLQKNHISPSPSLLSLSLFPMHITPQPFFLIYASYISSPIYNCSTYIQ